GGCFHSPCHRSFSEQLPKGTKGGARVGSPRSGNTPAMSLPAVSSRIATTSDACSLLAGYNLATFTFSTPVYWMSYRAAGYSTEIVPDPWGGVFLRRTLGLWDTLGLVA